MTTPIARRVEQLNPSIATHVTALKARVRERLAGAFGVLATVLVVAGLYGIVAYLAVTRRNEIGIRLSLGAPRAQIVRLVFRDNLWLLGVGLATGLPLGLGVMRGAGALLFGLTPLDVPTVVAATCLLTLAGLVAGALPARRAAQVRPEVALRGE